MSKILSITLHFETPDDLSVFTSGMNNALIAYHDVINAIKLGCEVPTKWHLFDNPEGEIKLALREKSLIDFYKQLEELENG